MLVGTMVRLGDGPVVGGQQRAPRSASQAGWLRGGITEVRVPAAPTPALTFNSHFQQGFSLSSPTNQGKGGAQSGERDAGCCSPRGLSISRHSEWTLTCLSTAVLRTAVPTHGHRVNIRRAHHGQRVAQPPSPPGDPSPSPHLLSPRSCLSRVIWGFFSGG